MISSKTFWNKRFLPKSEGQKISDQSKFAKWCLQFLPKTGQLLELGSWGGRDSLFFASKGYQILATDFSTKVLEHLKQSNLAVKYLDLTKTFPFKDHSFDIVYAHQVVHYFTKHITQQIFDEIFRILKPNGILAIACNSIKDPEYKTGKKIEDDYFEIAPGWRKRYFSIDSLKPFVKKFKTIVLDDQGQDPRRNYYHLIRFIGQKNVD